MFTIKKHWKKIKKDVENILNDKQWKPTVYFCKDGFIPEVSFTKGKIGSYEGFAGCSYMSDECSQGFMKRIASIIPKKYVKTY